MAKPINTSRDANANAQIVSTLIDELPKDVSAVVGINALGRLSEIMSHEEFVQFVDGALHHATTGQLPADAGESDNQEQDQQQPQAGAAPAPQTPQNGGTGNGTPSANY